MSTIAVDWSGALQPRGKLWLAQAVDGRVVRLEPFASRDALAADLIAQSRARPDTVVGWGRAGTTKPAGFECLRRTELDVSTTFAARPKSAFQIAGAGAVGTGSLRGMPYLAKLREEGFSIWPFDAPCGAVVVEIYPRLLTGPVVKSSAEARRAYLQSHSLQASRALAAKAAESEDAFDAALSALAMDRHRAALRRLARDAEPPYDIEGRTWWPR